MEVGQLWVKLGLDKSGFDNGVDDAKGQSSGLSGFIKNAFAFTVGQGMFDLLKTGIKSAWDTSIGFNSEMEQSQAAFTTLLGSASKAKTMLGDLSKFANETPFELGDLNKASQTLLGFGIDANKIMPDLKMLGDVSMGNKDKLQGLALVFAQVQSQGKLMGQDLLQMINNGFNPLQVISKQTGESMAELKDKMAKGQISADMVAKAFQGATEKGGLFYGAMDKQSKTFAGQMSTLSDNVKSTLGGVMKSQFEYLSNTLLPAAIDKVNKFGDAFKSGGLSAAMKTIIPSGLVDGLTSVGNAIQGAFGWIEQHGPLIKTVIAGLTAGFVAYKVAVMASIVQQEISNALEAIHAIAAGKSAVMLELETGMTGSCTAAQKLLNLAMSFNPYAIIALAIIALIGALVYLWNTNEGFRTAIIGIWNGIKSAFSTGIEAIKGFFTGFIEKIKSIPAVFEQFKAAIFQKMQDLKNNINSILNMIKQLFITIWNVIVSSVKLIIAPFITGIIVLFNGMKAGLSTTFNGLKDFFTGVWSVIKNIFLGAILLLIDLVTGNFTKLNTDVQAIFNNLKNAFSTIWEGIKLIFTGVVQTIAGFLKTEWDAIVNAAQIVWNSLRDFFSGLWESIKNTASTAWNTLKETVSTIIKNAVQDAKDIWNGLLDWFSELPDKLYNYGSNMFTSMRNGVTSTIGNVKSAVTDGIQSAIDWIKALPGEAVKWGSDMIDGIVRGIKSAAYAVGDAVNGVAQDIRKFLHFSVPDEGPLRDYESWMPDFIQGMAQGIDSNKSKLIDKIKGLASSMALNINGSFKGRNSDSNNTSKTTQLILQIDKFINNSSKDIENLAMELQQYMNMKNSGIGVKPSV